MPAAQIDKSPLPLEWPTLLLLAVVYAAYAAVTVVADQIGAAATVVALAVILAQHSSLQHEVLHGHPFANRRLSEATVFPAIGLTIPYQRFRDTHLAHHHDEKLTDPYDDPESNFLDPAVWARLPRGLRVLYGLNNTLLGRMLLGPAIGLARFYADDLRRLRRGEARIARAWIHHGLGVLTVLAWLAAFGTVAWWEYLAGAYLALSLLKIRTFLEHRAHERAAGRSVIVEDRGPLAFLFLNNNLHAVHHACPRVAWYRLPALYRRRRAEFVKRNRAYVFASYRDIFARYMIARKDPVAHPLWPQAEAPRHAPAPPSADITAATRAEAGPAGGPLPGVAAP